ncbi:unnamed protein product [Paramecium pentaurelia]|uniref:Ribosomal protein n=1 Tax=Paramecium pentaurelia TaxID=43138 RepID=A0A8S1XT73_9CILI|nr:unnamed protein product [Paramecium pentaurelia]CAD8203772.1 unnamed protein product [Paramecium pentaurelia]
MSKIQSEQLKKFIHEMLTERKKRNFKETTELQIQLRDYDVQKDKRFQGSTRLLHAPYPNIKIGVIGNLTHCDQAKALGLTAIDQEGLKKFNKEKKPIKKWCKPFDILIASESLMKVIPRLVGNVFTKIGKFPIAIPETESVGSKVNEVKSSVKFQLKNTLSLGTAFGTDEMTEDQLRQNLSTTINFLVSLLKKGWQNVGTLHIKTSMGKPIKIYG